MIQRLLVREIFDIEEFTNSKEKHEENIREFLNQSTDQDVLLFTDDSALGNPGPTGAGAVAYIDGYNSSPILFIKKELVQSLTTIQGS